MQLKFSKKIQITYKLVFKNRPVAAAERPVFSPFFLLFSFFPSLLLQGGNWNQNHEDCVPSCLLHTPQSSW